MSAPAFPPPLAIGIVGCGTIAGTYLAGAARSRLVRVAAVADIDPAAAARRAAEWTVPARSVEALLADPGIALVVNLTVPRAHADVSGRALAAGKHVYSEKPFAVTLAEGRALVAAAESAGLRLGSAPDTFLGAGHQTVRALVDRGAIGRVTGGAATFANGGMEMWHPAPFFFFEEGGGPVLDVGCYPIAQLVNCLGPVESVLAHATRPRETRTVTSAPHRGRTIRVEVMTSVNGVLAFASGASVAFTASWDIWKHARSPLELYGTEGSILNPDPNQFGGPVHVSDGPGDWREVPVAGRPFGAPTLAFPDGRTIADHRMAGVLDMAAAIARGRPHRCGAAFALHVLEVMEALGRAAAEGRRLTLSTTCDRPAPVPEGADEAVFL